MSEPKWLDPQEARVWSAVLWMMRGLDLALDHQLQRDARITHASYGILVGLSQQEGQSLPMGVLAQTLGWSQSRLSHAVARMEKVGWVRRVPSATDQRSNLAQLTEAGRQKLVEAAPGHVAAVRDLLIDALTPEQRDTLRQIGETVVDRAFDALGDAAPVKHPRDLGR
jgi:DNA-binding MarR family transcriptional regulator